MSHLSRDERLLALDGALDAARQSHLAGCPACGDRGRRPASGARPRPRRGHAGAVAAVLGSSRGAGRRCHRAGAGAGRGTRLVVAAPGVGGARRRRVRGGSRLSDPVGRTVRARRRARRAGRRRHRAGCGGRGAAAGPDIAADIESPLSDDGWALLTAVAEDTEPDETFAPVAGQAELSLSSLTAEERTALAAELAAELDSARTREG